MTAYRTCRTFGSSDLPGVAAFVVASVHLTSWVWWTEAHPVAHGRWHSDSREFGPLETLNGDFAQMGRPVRASDARPDSGDLCHTDSRGSDPRRPRASRA